MMHRHHSTNESGSSYTSNEYTCVSPLTYPKDGAYVLCSPSCLILLALFFAHSSSTSGGLWVEMSLSETCLLSKLYLNESLFSTEDKGTHYPPSSHAIGLQAFAFSFLSSLSFRVKLSVLSCHELTGQEQEPRST
jgi:hypothetical protein